MENEFGLRPGLIKAYHRSQKYKIAFTKENLKLTNEMRQDDPFKVHKLSYEIKTNELIKKGLLRN